MENLIGRAPEIRILKEALASPHSELVAIYGRRRVGKTYLIQNPCPLSRPRRVYGALW